MLYINYYYGDFARDNKTIDLQNFAKQNILNTYRSTLKQAFNERLQFAVAGQYSNKEVEDFFKKSMGTGKTGYIDELETQLQALGANFNRLERINPNQDNSYWEKIISSDNPGAVVLSLAQEDSTFLTYLAGKVDIMLTTFEKAMSKVENYCIASGNKELLTRINGMNNNDIKVFKQQEIFKGYSESVKDYMALKQIVNELSEVKGAIGTGNYDKMGLAVQGFAKIYASTGYVGKELADTLGAGLAATSFAKEAVSMHTGATTKSLGSNSAFMKEIIDPKLLSQAKSEEQLKNFRYNKQIKDDSEMYISSDIIRIIFGISSKNRTFYENSAINYRHQVLKTNVARLLEISQQYGADWAGFNKYAVYNLFYGRHGYNEKKQSGKKSSGEKYDGDTLSVTWKNMIEQYARLGMIDALMGNSIDGINYGNNSLVFVSGKNVFYMGDIINAAIKNPAAMEVTGKTTRASNRNVWIKPERANKTLGLERSQGLLNRVEGDMREKTITVKLNISLVAATLGKTLSV